MATNGGLRQYLPRSHAPLAFTISVTNRPKHDTYMYPQVCPPDFRTTEVVASDEQEQDKMLDNWKSDGSHGAEASASCPKHTGLIS